MTDNGHMTQNREASLRRARGLVSWACVLAWMGLISYLSEIASLSSETSGPGVGVGESEFWLGFIPRWMLAWIYHGTMFGGLTFITYVAIRLSSPFQWQKAAWLAFAVAVSYASIDEWHQSFVVGRTSDIRDVGMDAIGALFVILIARGAELSLSGLTRHRHSAVG